MNQTYLFVYGTLLSNYEHPMAHFLIKNSKLIGEGYMRGILYEVAWYPGAVYDITTEKQVKGQIVEIENIKTVFQELDAYEGSAYIRKKVPIQQGDRTLYCWVYLFILPINDLEEIISGDYLKYVANKSR